MYASELHVLRKLEIQSEFYYQRELKVLSYGRPQNGSLMKNDRYVGGYSIKENLHKVIKTPT